MTCCSLALATLALGQQEAPPTIRLAYELDSGWAENPSRAPEVVISFPVVVEGAEWLRLYFEDLELSGDPALGNASILRLTALEDGATQEMDARHLRQWQNSSCYFNGDTVLVEVLAQPASGWNRVAMRAVDYGLPFTPEESICGNTDDRTLSNDPRAARLLPVGCTGWLIDDCAQCFLTAGHCAGNVSVVQFNVPLSNSNGSLNHPPPSDQYAADPSSMQDNGGAGVGNDWAYFGAFANTNTGLTPGQAAGSTYILANPPPVAGNNIRITGYGVDGSPATRNQVQQTELGPLVTSSGSLVQYRTDTTGGNSGSPVIWENTGQAIGIHTHGGCSASGGQNSGTGINHSGLQSALASAAGVCAGGIHFPTPLPELAAPGVPLDLTIELEGPGTAVSLHYRLQPGAFSTLAMTAQSPTLYTVALPAPACSDTPEFYFSYVDNVCGPLTSPDDAPLTFYSVAVGTLQTTWSDDFESDLGWSTTVVNASGGAWERGVPINDPNWIYDPVADSDGSGSCFLTENQLGDTDVDGGNVRLFSPLFDLSPAGSFIAYDYFLNLSMEHGVDRLEVAARNNGVGPWTLLVAHDTSGGLAWRSQSVSASEIAAAGLSLTSSVQIRFQAREVGTASILEAGVDHFRVGSALCGGGPGTSYCSSGVNGATISASGSASVAANDLRLVGSGLPGPVSAMFFYGDGQDNTPLGGGTLCVSGTGGLFRLQPVQSADSAGSISHALDLNAPPVAAGQILAGSTWNFQLWFRDGNSSDLTDGLQVVFGP